MNYEENRLRTFKNWPSNAGVDPRKIAKAGFYFMGQGAEVQCFSCGGRISDWNYGDRVVAVITRHKRLDPGCPFIKDPQAAGNVPITSSTTRSPSESSQSPRVSESESSHSGAEPSSDPGHAYSRVSCSKSLHPKREVFKNEPARVQSFFQWPVPYISPELLAKAGFFYTGQYDKVECYFCEGTVEGWEEGDCPLEEHRRHFPTCPFLTSISHGVNIRTPESANFRGDYDELKWLGIRKHRIPKCLKYSTFETRLQSFENWPPSIPQTPHQLAEAGFYSTGRVDQVRCFHCDGGLSRWEAGDEPWEEHARWFSDCGYVFLVRGQQFIDHTLNTLRCFPSAIEVEGRGVKRKPEAKVRIVSDEELQTAMSSPQAVTALEIGLEVYRVKMALKEKLETTGQPFSRSEDLIGAAFAVQSQEDSDQEESWGTPPNSPAIFGKSRFSPRRECLTRQSSSCSPKPSRSRDAVSSSPRDSPVRQNSSSSSGSDRNSKYKQAVEDNLPVMDDIKPLLESDKQKPVIASKSISALEEEIRRLREWRQCKVCMDREVGVVLLPCGHLVTCALCTYSLGDCPLCRQSIQATVRTFLS